MYIAFHPFAFPSQSNYHLYIFIFHMMYPRSHAFQHFPKNTPSTIPAYFREQPRAAGPHIMHSQGALQGRWWKRARKIRFGMCYKHIPKEYLRREIIRISRPNIFGSYFTGPFPLTDCKQPKTHYVRFCCSWRPLKLYRITSILSIRYCSIHLRLLCFSIFEEFNSNLWEQSVRQYIFILLDPLFAFFAECI